MAPFALPTPMAAYRLSPRALGGTETPSTIVSSASATSAPASATSSASSQQQQQDWNWGGSHGQILNWAAIAVVVGLLCAVGGWRYATARHRSVKGLFLPKGLKIKSLGINISPPPPGPQRATLQELELQRRAQRAETRFQRRRTRGDNIGEGGQRRDGRTSPDGDSDDEADRDTLPGYKTDTAAPVYLEEWREHAVVRGDVPEIDVETADAIRANGDVVRQTAAVDSTAQATGDAGQERIMTVAEYEARSRGQQGERDAADDVQRAPMEDESRLVVPTVADPPPAAITAASRPEPQRTHSGQPPKYEVPLRD